MVRQKSALDTINVPKNTYSFFTTQDEQSELSFRFKKQFLLFLTFHLMLLLFPVMVYTARKAAWPLSPKLLQLFIWVWTQDYHLEENSVNLHHHLLILTAILLLFSLPSFRLTFCFFVFVLVLQIFFVI